MSPGPLANTVTITPMSGNNNNSLKNGKILSSGNQTTHIYKRERERVKVAKIFCVKVTAVM